MSAASERSDKGERGERSESRPAAAPTPCGDTATSARDYDLLFETMLQGVVFQDAEGRIVSMNPAAERILGRSPAEFLDQTSVSVEQATIREDGSPFPGLEHPSMVALRTGRMQRGVVMGVFNPREQAYRWSSISAVPLFRPGEARPYLVYGLFDDVTARRAADKALQESEATLRAILDATRESIWLFGVDGVALAANRTALARWGGAPETVLGKNLLDFLPAELARSRLARLQEAAGTRQPVEFEDTRAGIVFEHTFCPVVDAPGRSDRIDRVAVFSRDVTERRRTEHALREEEARFRRVFEHSADAILLTRHDGSIIDANPAACRMHDMTMERIRAAGLAGLVVADQGFDALLARREAEGHAEAELTMRRRDGTTFLAEVESTLVDAASPDWTTVVFCRDVTERKRVELERRQAEAAELARRATEQSAAELREAQRIAGVGSWSLDFATGAASWSDEMFRIAGRDPSQGAAGLDDAEAFVGREAMARLRMELERVHSGQGSMTTELEMLRADGGARRVVLRAEAARDERQRGTGARGTLQDVTEQRRLEQQVSRNQRLDAIGSLAGGVAHDFNNILGSILAYAGIAIEGLDEKSRVRGELEEIVAAVRRASSLTRQLLAFGQRQVLKPVVFAPDFVIRDLCKMLRRLIGENVDLRLHLADDAGCIRADRSQIEQVIMNLIVNARDAMTGRGILRLETRAVDVDAQRAPPGVRPGPYWQLSVSDTGCGMDAATQARIFEPFFTTKPPGAGTGLGLSTVHGIVQQSGGFLEVESAVGRGTTFRVLLPRAADGPARELASDPASVRPARGDGTVLVVEDDPTLRDVVARSLTQVGYDVVRAAGGEEALRRAREHGRIDVLVSDVVMPGLSGPELAKALRETRPDLAVIFVSGYVDKTWGASDVLLEGEHFLPKPFANEELVRKVAEVRAAQRRPAD